MECPCRAMNGRQTVTEIYQWMRYESGKNSTTNWKRLVCSEWKGQHNKKTLTVKFELTSLGSTKNPLQTDDKETVSVNYFTLQVTCNDIGLVRILNYMGLHVNWNVQVRTLLKFSFQQSVSTKSSPMSFVEIHFILEYQRRKLEYKTWILRYLLNRNRHLSRALSVYCRIFFISKNIYIYRK